MNLCYDCGKPIDPKDEDKEHIPQKCLLDDVPTDQRGSFITIPAHKTCNNKYSKIDNALRDIIGLSSDEESKTTDKSIRSLLRQSDEKIFSKVSFEKKEAYINFNIEDVRNSHIKNFKGIFYREYGQPLPDDFDVNVLTDFNNFEDIQNGIKLTQRFLEMPNVRESISGSAEVFKARTIALSPQGNPIEIFNEGILLVISELIYHNKMSALVIARKIV
jgi:hypothetical protein